MYRFIFNRIKKIIPKISETELIALHPWKFKMGQNPIKISEV